ncbi:hypothetical protein Dimus_008297 [Dionaea muscipula]
MNPCKSPSNPKVNSPPSPILLHQRRVTYLPLPRTPTGTLLGIVSLHRWVMSIAASESPSISSSARESPSISSSADALWIMSFASLPLPACSVFRIWVIVGCLGFIPWARVVFRI